MKKKIQMKTKIKMNKKNNQKKQLTLKIKNRKQLSKSIFRLHYAPIQTPTQALIYQLIKNSISWHYLIM